MPIGNSRNTRPNWLPSLYAFSSGRRLTGTSARIITPSVASPLLARYSRSAPATQDSSTSLTEAPSARPTTFTSSSGRGSVHATRFATPGVPLKRVGESCPISASFAISAPSAPPCSASATAFAGCVHRSTPRSISVDPTLSAALIALAIGWTMSPSGSSFAVRSRALGRRWRERRRSGRADDRSSTAAPGRARCRPRSNGGCGSRPRCRRRNARPGGTATAASAGFKGVRASRETSACSSFLPAAPGSATSIR